MKTKYLLVVVGPTGIGKTALAIKIARYFQTDIVSADSRQFFKEMEIGTAVPEPEELSAATHHFIQHRSVREPYNVGAYEREAIAKLDVLFETKDAVVLVGGSGLYVDAVINGLDNFPTVKTGIREELMKRLETEGISVLQELLKEKDPEYYKNADIKNPQRITRALEVCLSSGQPYSSFLATNTVKRNFNVLKIGLTAEREIIYDRINRRVDMMFEKGLENEARRLHPLKELNALQTVGYNELFDYFDGTTDLQNTIEEIKKNTRRFAKRQLTWYRKDKSIFWFDYKANFQEIIALIKEKTSL